ncbi:MAG TPA: L-lactate permease [Anaerolineales bacterium]|nr:L-lactate permease [Anaerolineales bacterium]
MLLSWLLASLPVLLLVGLMIGLRWGAARAGPAGWLAAAAVAVLAFGAGTDLLAVAQAKAFFQSLDVLLIVSSAYLLYRVVDEAGGVTALAVALPRVTPDRGLQALLIGWAYASFLQGVGGFGVPVVVTAPILAGLGFGPIVSVVAPSVGHAWSVTFGSLGSSFQAMMSATGIAGEVLAAPAAILLGILGLGCGAGVAWIAVGRGELRRLAVPIVAMGVVMSAVQYALAVNRLWNIAGFGGGLAGLAVGLLLARGVASRRDSGVGEPINRGDLALALAGYAALVVITFSIVLIQPLSRALSFVSLQAEFPATVTRLGFQIAAEPGKAIVLFRHAGAALTYSALAAYAVYAAAGRFRSGAAGRILKTTAQGILPSWVGISAMLSMASIMTHAGMTEAIAGGLASAAGPAFSLVAPWMGALGAFISGSNTSSNLLFGMLQRRTAEMLGMSVAWILAGQTAGAAVGSVVSPAKVVVGTASVSEAEAAAPEEGVVLRRLLGPAALLVGLVSVAALVLWLGGWL